jgi:tetratricopeptide (TPR) repeat protein
MSDPLRRTLIGLLVAPVLLAALASAEEPSHEKPPWQRLLQGDDARKAQMLEGRLQELQEAGKFEAALAIAEELAAMRTRLQGANHWQAVDAKYAAEAVRKVSSAEKDGRAKYTAGFSHQRQAVALVGEGRYRDAQPLLEKVLAVRRKVLGEEHPDTARSYNNVAYTLKAQGRYREAEEGFKKALAICRKVLGEEHPDTANGYNNVAFNLDARGRHKEAEEGFRKALAIRRKVLGEEHSQTAQSYNNLAANLKLQGQYAQAAEGYQKALSLYRKVLGEEHPDTALAYNNLAASLNAQGKYGDAVEGYQKALGIRRKVLGEGHPDTAQSCNNLALNLYAQGRYTQAGEGFQQALAIYRKVFGEEHPATATSHNNLAYTSQEQGRHAEAAEDFQKVLAIRRKVLGEAHPDTAASYHNLALNLHAQGKYAEAEEYLLRAAKSFAVARLRVAPTGLERATATSEHSPLPWLVAILARNGKTAEAWRQYEESLARGTWDDLSARLRRQPAERTRQAELVARLQRLDQRIEMSLSAKEKTPQQEKAREALLGQRRQVQDELDAFAHHLEQLHGPAAGQVFDLPRIQAALPDDAALIGWLDLPPTGPTALDPSGEHWAFLLRSSGPPVCVRLRGSGPGGAWAEEDTDLPAKLRSALIARRSDWQRLARRLSEQRLNPLRRDLAATEKLPAVRHLVVLPSAALAGVPLEALGEDVIVSHALSGTLHAHLRTQPAVAGTRLLALGDPIFEAGTKEEPLPPGGVLLTLVQPGSNAAEARLRSDDVLLKYGDRELTIPKDLQEAIAAADGKGDVTVQLWRDGKVHSREVHRGKLGVVLATDPAPRALAERYRLDRFLTTDRGDDSWGQLPGTRVEVESLRHLFGSKAESMVLFDSDASEQKLDELAASGELSKYRYLHLATHGEVDNSRALRSAVILSRDSLPDAQQQLVAGKPVYDGRLTAEEMLRSWNLHSELVTLSACQTALGKYERGEGFVGFAQALLLCGSRSVCLSLWKVDDGATALLMQRFYANLLGKREGLKGPMPKATALREAKQWLRNLSREEALKVAAGLSKGVERGKGRPKAKLLPAIPEPEPAEKEDRPYAHPYCWAAFVLIGDPS